MHIKRRSSLFVSYLYNYFKVSTDFGFPFREKSIKPCSPGLSGESVRIISLHGAVAGTVAPRAHTALRACNLRLKLPTLLSFINNGELFSAHCGGQHTRHLPHFLQHPQQLLCWLSTEGQYPNFLFSPHSRKSYWPPSPYDSWVEIWVNL